MSGNQEEEKAKPIRDVDLTAAGRGVWLVKVSKNNNMKNSVVDFRMQFRFRIM